MAGIGIVGSGISGLTLALFLQQQGIDATVYAERTPEELRAGRLLNSVVRFHPTRERERLLGVDHWEFADFGVSAIHVDVGGEQPLAFTGRLQRPASAVDFRIYLARPLEDFERRGGRVVPGRRGPEEVRRLGRHHDLVVVASGRDTPAALFPRVPARSPFTAPQRILCAGLYHGVGLPDPMGVGFHIAPGAGGIFQTPMFSFAGRVSALLFEALPGGPLEALAHRRYEDDPAGFECSVLALLAEFAPGLRARVDSTAFGLTRPEDLLQGAVTPTVRRGVARLDGGVHAMAVGDAWILNDPIAGQGAHLGSQSAWTLGSAIADSDGYDDEFGRRAEAAMWPFAQSVTEFSNAFLRPPTPQLGQLLAAAAADPAVTDALLDQFADPPAMWRTIASPAGAAAFITRVTHRQEVTL